MAKETRLCSFSPFTLNEAFLCFISALVDLNLLVPVKFFARKSIFHFHQKRIQRDNTTWILYQQKLLPAPGFELATFGWQGRPRPSFNCSSLVGECAISTKAARNALVSVSSINFKLMVKKLAWGLHYKNMQIHKYVIISCLFLVTFWYFTQ